MLINRNSRILKLGLGQLDQPEKDYMENLADSLLKIQNAVLPPKTGKKDPKKRKKEE
jgi:hypothetical protein